MNSRISALVVPLILAAVSNAQCPDWVPEFTPGHADGSIVATIAFDDGSGPALYLGGTFSRIGTTNVARVARRNGTSITPVGSGLGGQVNTLAVLDDGTGPALYAGGVITILPAGTPTSVARWDGAQWNALGPRIPGPYPGDSYVSSLAAYDSGAGPKLYVGGAFQGGFAGNGELVRRFDGANWVTLGSEGPGAHPFFTVPYVHTLLVYDDGSGSKLYAGGRFLVVSGQPGGGVARFNGTAWETVTIGNVWGPSNEGATTTSLAVHDFGAGTALYATGFFDLGAGVSTFARFANASWSAIPLAATEQPQRARSIAASGSVTGGLYLLGTFTTPNPGTTDVIARFDGVQLQPVGLSNVIGPAHDFASFDDGTGARLFTVGGTPNGALGTFGVLENGAWSLIEPGNAPTGNNQSLASIDDDGDGRASLFVGGTGTFAGATRVHGLARYDRGTWTDPVPIVTSGFCRALDVVTEGGEDVLYASGSFFVNNGSTNVLRIAGASVSTLGPTNPQFGNAFCVARFDAGTGALLFVGHQNGLRAYDGANWTVPLTVGGAVGDLLTFDDGTGLALYASGPFTTAGGVNVPGLMRWNGTSVESLAGAGPWTLKNGGSMVLYDDGGGAKLVVTGYFSNAGAPNQFAIARLDGPSWTPIALTFAFPVGQGAPVNRLLEHDAAGGRQLVATGIFTAIEGVSAANIARFDGTSWSAFGSGLQAAYGTTGVALVDHDFGDGAGPDLVVTGVFQTAGGGLASTLARYRACGDASAFCFGDGSGTACPCGNAGAVGHGCGNSNFASGALLSVSGRAQVSSDTLTLVCTNVSNGTPALFYQGTAQVNGGNGIVFGDGFACVTGALIRLGVRFTTSGEANFGAASGPGAISTLGFVPGAGGTRNYGCRYRSDIAFCSHAGFNYSNAVNVTWAP